jgi:bifunctional UDP-N-acetylglucosamine pyrophosphorylase/glucosamine-1-phosphate N-acetyltransferase
MTNASFSTVILAAGKGTRMRSNLPKVLHQVAGKPLIAHVLASVAPLSPKATVVVVANGMEDVKLASSKENPNCLFAIQEQQRGTGDAVRSALPQIDKKSEYTLVLYGDTPLMRTETLRTLLDKEDNCDVADPTGYGRLIVNHSGLVEAIVECKDASTEQKAITLCNSGIMAIKNHLLPDLLSKLNTNNANGEYYLTDIIALANDAGHHCMVVEADAAELGGINTRVQLAAAEEILQNRLRKAAMDNGATLIDPSSVFFSVDTKIGQDVVIAPNVFFGANVTIGNNVEIRSFCHIEGAAVEQGAIVGPFARLRPGTVMAENSHVGNFVELKNTKLGKGAKANHLSYVGDSDVGAAANIGAGTITCNYDGVNKYRTTIGAGAFIGSNSSLVAPVSIGDGAMVGAGSVITENVEANALAIARGTQVAKAGKAELIRNKKKH